MAALMNKLNLNARISFRFLGGMSSLSAFWFLVFRDR